MSDWCRCRRCGHIFLGEDCGHVREKFGDWYQDIGVCPECGDDDIDDYYPPEEDEEEEEEEEDNEEE